MSQKVAAYVIGGLSIIALTIGLGVYYGMRAPAKKPTTGDSSRPTAASSSQPTAASLSQPTSASSSRPTTGGSSKPTAESVQVPTVTVKGIATDPKCNGTFPMSGARPNFGSAVIYKFFRRESDGYAMLLDTNKFWHCYSTHDDGIHYREHWMTRNEHDPLIKLTQ